MKTSLTTLIKVSFQSILFRFMILFISISLLIQMINFATYHIYLNIVESRIEANYDLSLANVASSLNHLFEGIYQSNFLLSLDPSVLNTFSLESSKENIADYADISQTVRSLARIKYIDSSIESAYILKRKDNLIISNEGTYSASHYYDNVYPMDAYPSDFWRTYTSTYKLFSILPPSQMIVSEDKESKIIIPIVQSKIAEYWSNNLYVINLNAQYIIQLLQNYRLTPGSLLFIADADGTMLASSEQDFLQHPELQAFMGDIMKSPDSKTTLTYNNQKMRVIKVSTQFFYNKVEMIAAVPDKDIRSSLYQIEQLRYWSAGFTFLLSLILSAAFSRNLYAPIRSLVNRMNGSQTSKRNKNTFKEFRYLNDEIGRMMTNVQSLNQALSYALPLANEQFLVKMLKNNYAFDDDSFKQFQNNSTFSFENDCFMIALLQFNFRKPYYTSFEEAFQYEASRRLLQLMRSMLPTDYPCYILELDSQIFCLLINVPRSADHSLYEAYCREMTELFRGDKDFIRVCAGIGNVHEGYQGIRQSYIEAMQALWRISPFDEQKVYKYNEAEEGTTRYLMTNEDENRLFNLLLSGKKEQLHLLLQQIIQQNMVSGTSASLMSELYMRFYLIGLQVLKQRNKTIDEEIGKQYTSFILSNHTFSADEIIESALSFFEHILTVSNESQETFDATSFKRFIDEHFHEDIHLEYLAQKYNTSAQYMSRLLKRELGVGFQEYLLDLRIRKAKELLIHSDQKISDIWESVGFNNRNTFIRAFKNKEGITPSEFRNSMNKQ